MRLIVVDDDRLVVDSLKIILGAQPQIEVVGTGANGDDAVALYAEHAPDIALLDIQMPGRDGLSAAREILERDPSARVVFLTTFSDDEYIVSALKLGARGYLIKTDVAAIPPALAQVMDGKRILAYMGEGTVRNHISSILAKMGLRNRTQIAIAYLRGQLPNDRPPRHSKMAVIDLMPFQNHAGLRG